ncbi:hypothetical protein ACFL5U_00100 [Candidatus Margulisiibacteriota bacterium]
MKALKTILIVLTAYCLLLSSVALAQGQAGLDIATLKAGVGARPLGMGSAFTAIANNADAPYWNPGGLGFISDKNEITTMQTKLSTDADHYYVSYIRPALGGTLGISWIQVGLGNITQTSAEVDLNNEVVDLSIFSYFSNAYMLSYGREINDMVSLGLTAKYLTSDMFQISGGQAYGYSVTPGILIRFTGKEKQETGMVLGKKSEFKDETGLLSARRISGKKYPGLREKESSQVLKPGKTKKPSRFAALMSGLTLGIKIDELLNEQSWGTGTKEYVPAKLRIGLAYARSNPGLFALDVSQTLKSGYAATASVGYEWFKEGLAIRFGYDDGMTAGAGFESGNTRVDYAFVTQQDLSRENVHRISLTGMW